MGTIQNTISTLQDQLGSAQLVVVTKRRSTDQIKQVIQAGAKAIGENRLKEVQEKYDPKLLQMLKDEGVKLHFVGHLQTNKATKVVQICDVIQSVDSLRLAKEVNKQAEKAEKTMPIFLQLNLTEEEQKHGLCEAEFEEILAEVKRLPHLKLLGLMCMGKSEDESVSRQAFQRCKALADQYNLPECSMGMSGDYPIAVEEGSTMVRIGSRIFQEP